MIDKQRTLKEAFSLKGKGLHTGTEVSITFKPAPPHTGYRFIRTDLENKPEIPALADYVVDIARSTILEHNGAKLQTIEHVLSALYGCMIDNCFIEMDAQEPPILDGSARYFVEGIEKAGIVTQEAAREYFEVKRPLTIKNEETGSEVTLLPDTEYRIDAHIAFESSPFLSNQYATLNSLIHYKEEVSDCRTFVFLRELEFLLQNNMVKGGDLNNAIVIMDREVPQQEIDRLADLFGQESKPVKGVGVISNSPLKYDNEPARHKLLDVIGDLALCGKFIKGRVIATKPGHYINTEMAKLIRKEMKIQPPFYDPNQAPKLTVNDIKKILPHRPPFLLVDKILDYTETSIVGLKNVTMNEAFFVGHFPEEPVMPGVIIVEAMAQCGGIMVLKSVEDPQKYSTYFMKINNFKFKQKVVPGDTLIFKLDTISNRRGIVHMDAKAYVGDKVVAEGDFKAQVVKNK